MCWPKARLNSASFNLTFRVPFSPPLLYISTFASPGNHLFPPTHHTQVFQEDQTKQLTLIYIRVTHKCWKDPKQNSTSFGLPKAGVPKSISVPCFRARSLLRTKERIQQSSVHTSEDGVIPSHRGC